MTLKERTATTTVELLSSELLRVGVELLLTVSTVELLDLLSLELLRRNEEGLRSSVDGLRNDHTFNDPNSLNTTLSMAQRTIQLR